MNTSGEPLHKRIADSIRQDIRSGVLRDRQVLPSTRELAEKWDVSVFTIGEAMKVLVAEGVVDAKPRSGRVVNAPQANQKDPEECPADIRSQLIALRTAAGDLVRRVDALAESLSDRRPS
ncbi:MAG: winged helix-turn-helix domain-containing protein [Actinomycetota bacterium]|nr:winged helix-turn-helix domain-containing protein [Actinomycetota bacterium]